jgi:hypothetical protein
MSHGSRTSFDVLLSISGWRNVRSAKSLVGQPKPNENYPESQSRRTRVVSREVFKQVYDSPFSLPGKYRWVTTDEDVRAIEKILEIPPKKHRCAGFG